MRSHRFINIFLHLKVQRMVEESKAKNNNDDHRDYVFICNIYRQALYISGQSL